MGYYGGGCGDNSFIIFLILILLLLSPTPRYYGAGQ